MVGLGVVVVVGFGVVVVVVVVVLSKDKVMKRFALRVFVQIFDLIIVLCPLGV